MWPPPLSHTHATGIFVNDIKYSEAHVKLRFTNTVEDAYCGQFGQTKWCDQPNDNIIYRLFLFF